jgi:tetratricopeptide (TPR) repeat protein
MIDRGQIDEAIAHCKSILKEFPKHIETYRLLGKCYLESQRYVEAADILQRVLSVYPDDFISHIGMSIICEDENNLEKAIWHMERSLEVQPSNSAVNSELRRLLTLRDGSEPSKVHLSQGAYIRMCVKSGLHEQAIAEAKSALSKEPQRIDLDLILAKMYFEINQQSNALDQLTIILNKLPYCYDANLLMSQILLASNRSSELKIYTDRLIAIDPYYAFVNSDSPTPDLVADDAVSIEKSEWQYEDDDTQRHTKILGTDWQDSKGPLASSGVTTKSFNQDSLPTDLPDENMIPSVEGALMANLFEQVVESEQTGESEEKTQEFKELRQEISPDPVVSSDLPEEQNIPSPTIEQEVVEPVGLEGNAEQDLPDWMKAAGWVQSDGQIEETPAVEISSSEPIQSNEIPDWIKTMAPVEESPSANELAQESEKMQLLEKILPEAPESSAVDTNADNAEGNFFPAIESQSQTTPENVVTFESLLTSASSEPQNEPPQEESAEPQGQDLPNWSNLAESTSKPVQPSQEETSSNTSLPVWMELDDQVEEPKLEFPDQKSLASQAEQPGELPIASSNIEIPEWITSDQPNTKIESQSQKNVDNLDNQQQETSATSPDVYSSYIREPDSLPVWLTSGKTSQIESSGLPDDEIPEWLRDEVPASMDAASPADETLISPSNSISPQITEVEPIFSNQVDSEIPDWLKEVNTDQNPVLSIPDEDILPEWARPAPTPDQQMTSPADLVMESFLQTSVPEDDNGNEIKEPEVAPEQVIDLSRINQPTAQESTDNQGLDSLLDQLSQGGYVNQNEPTGSVVGSVAVQEEPTIQPDPLQSETSFEESPFLDSESFSEDPRGDETLVSKPFLESEKLEESSPPSPVNGISAEILSEITPIASSPLEDASPPVFNIEYGQASQEPVSVVQPIIESSVLDQSIQDDTLDMTADIDIESWLNSLEEVSNLPAPETPISIPELQVKEVQEPDIHDIAKPAEFGSILQTPEIPLPDTAPLVGLDEAENAADLSPLDELEEAGHFRGMPPVENIVASLTIESSKAVDVSPSPTEEDRPMPVEPDPQEAIPPKEPQAYENLLDYANASVSEGNLEDAINAFNNLIKKGNNIEETIQSLRSAVYRYPSEVIVWQALGDGYAKSNRLQEALDAYSKAEELIK